MVLFTHKVKKYKAAAAKLFLTVRVNKAQTQQTHNSCKIPRFRSVKY